MKKVCIIGLGYVGLPLACRCAEKGFEVIGFDVDKKKISLINSGISPINDPFLKKKLKKFKSRIKSSNNASVISEADTIIVCVPTPIDNNNIPDLRELKSAVKLVSMNLRKEQLILIESTVYPGTMEEVIEPILFLAGIVAGKDYYLAYCPERIDPGNKKWTVSTIPRVLAGKTDNCVKKAVNFYSSIIDAKIIPLKSFKEAEAVKITENCFRDINIAFINELAKSFDKLGIDIAEVIKGASSKPFGFMPFFPGPGVGGHCISIDPYYLIDRANSKGFDHRFLKLAREINDSMPYYILDLIEEGLKRTGKTFSDASIGILGVAYKKDVDDIRNSPALKVIEELNKKKSKIKIFDPLVKKLSNVKDVPALLSETDCLVLLTDHSQFKKISLNKIKSSGVKLLVDGRNFWNKKEAEEEGLIYISIGGRKT